MDLKSATGMILSESASHPELLRVSRHVYDELAAGRVVGHRMLSGMLREAARKNLYPALMAKHGDRAFEDMVMALAREIDRQAPIVRH
jgi:hypothetical protein